MRKNNLKKTVIAFFIMTILFSQTMTLNLFAQIDGGEADSTISPVSEQANNTEKPLPEPVSETDNQFPVIEDKIQGVDGFVPETIVPYTGEQTIFQGIRPASAGDLVIGIYNNDDVKVGDLSGLSDNVVWGPETVLILKVEANFPTTDTDKVVTINLGDEFAYSTYPTMDTLAPEQVGAITSMTKTIGTKILNDKYTLPNGELSYTIAPGFERVTLEIGIKPFISIKTGTTLQEIMNGIIVTESYGGSVQDTQVLEKATINKTILSATDVTVLPKTAFNQPNTHRVNIYQDVTNVVGDAINAYVESAVYTIKYPEGVEVVSLPANTGDTVYSDDPGAREVKAVRTNTLYSLYSLTWRFSPVFQVVNNGTLAPGDTLNYTFTADIKKYKEPVETWTKDYTQTIEEALQSTELKGTSLSVYNRSYNTDLYQTIAGFSFKNTGNIDTKEKKVTYKFTNDNIGVSRVNIPVPGLGIGPYSATIKYKMVGDTAFRTFTGNVALSDATTSPSSHTINFNNRTIGQPGKYFSEIIIENIGSYQPGYSLDSTTGTNVSLLVEGRFLTDQTGTYDVGIMTMSNVDGTDEQIANLDGSVKSAQAYEALPVHYATAAAPETFAGKTIDVTALTYPAERSTGYVSQLYDNPIIYIVEKNGLTFGGATISYMDNNHVIPYTTTRKDLGNGEFVTVIDFTEAVRIGLYSETFANRGLKLNLKLNSKNNLPSQEIDFTNYIFMGFDHPNYSISTYSGALGTKVVPDTKDFNDNGKTEPLLAFAGKFNLKAQKDIVLSNAIKLSTETDWYTFSSGGKIAAFNAGSTADYKFDVLNTSGNPVTAFKYYIPVPKKGQDFGINFQPEAFSWDMALTGGINVPLGYKVSYSTDATAPETSEYAPQGTFVDEASVGTSNWGQVNMICIENTAPIPDGANESFLLQYLIDETPASTELLSGKINKFSPYGYRDFTTVKGSSSGEMVAAQLVTGKIEGKAFNDLNRNGIQDPGDTVLSGVSVKLTDESGVVVSGQPDVTTDPNGKYSFSNLSPKKYKVTVSNPGSTDSLAANAFKFTLANVGSDATINSKMVSSADQITGSALVTIPSTTAVNTDVGFIKPYTVTYATSANGTIGSPATIGRWPGETIGTNMPTTTPATNYRLEGWVKDTDPNAQTEAAIQGFTVNQDVKFTARFIGLDQTLTFNSQGGVFASEPGTPATIDKVAPFDKTFTFPAAPTKSHYIFAGWYKDEATTADQEVVEGTYIMPLGPTSLYAKWTSKALQPDFNFIQNSPMAKTYGDDNFTVNAGGGAGTGTVTYELVSGPGTINSTTGEVTITGAGPIVVKATKAEDATNDTAVATLTINVAKAILTATTINQTSVYGDAVPALPSATVNGFVLGEDTTAAGYIAPTVSYTTIPGTPANVETYGYTISGGAATNYTFTYDTTKALTITKALQPELTFTDASVTKTYGDVDFTNVISGGAGTGALTYTSSDMNKATVDATGKVTIKGAGIVTITATKASDANYSNTVTKTYTLTINKKDLTVTADSKTKLYLAANPTLTLGYTGFVTGDDVSKLTGTKPTASTTAVANSSVGTYPITVDVTSATDTNYNFVKGPDATLIVTEDTQPDLIFADASVTKTYGDVDFTNAISGGAGTGALTFESSDSAVAEIDAATGLVTITGVGTATITATKLGDTNYSNTVTKTYTITVNKKELTATPDSKVKVYGAANEALTISYTGFVNGEGEVNLTGTLPTITTAATDSSNAGSYPITVDVASATDANYTFVKGTDATYTISKKNQSAITFEDATVEKTYGDVVFEDALTSIGSGTGELIYTSSDESKATVDQNGQVTITGAGSVTITAKKIADGNHTSDVTATFELTVKKKDMTVTPVDQTKVYKEDNPTLTMTYEGFVNGDDVDQLGSKKPILRTTAVKNSPVIVGGYPITVDITEAEDANYNYVQGTNGTLTITQATQPELDFANNTISKTYGDGSFTETPTGGAGEGALTYSSSNTAIVEVDSATGQIGIKSAGTATITATKVGDTNYSNTVEKAYELTINKANLIAIASNETMVAGQNLPAGSIQVTGFKYTDTVSSAKGYETPKVGYATNGATAGTYTINVSGGKADDYTFMYTTGTLTVNPAPIPPAPPVGPVIPENKGSSTQIITKEISRTEGDNKSEIKEKESTVKASNSDNTMTKNSSKIKTNEPASQINAKNSKTIVYNLSVLPILIIGLIARYLISKKEKERILLENKGGKNTSKSKNHFVTIVSFIGLAFLGATYIYGLMNLSNGSIVGTANIIITSITVGLAILWGGKYIQLSRAVEKLNKTII